MKPTVTKKRKRLTPRKPRASRPELKTRAEAAKALKIAPRALDRAIERGAPGPVAGRRGTRRYPVAALRRWLVAREQPEDSGRPNLTAERARLVGVQRELAELKLAIASGKLIDRAAEDRRDFEIARTVRDSILNVPDRIASELAAESDAARVHERLTAELTKCLSSLADVLEHGPDDDGGAAAKRPER
jgi:phage terminase Nu1 subunit (DNA packaging protein)